MTDIHIYRGSPNRNKACVCAVSPAAVEWMLINMDVGPFDGQQVVVDLDCIDELEQAFAESGLAIEVIR